MGRSQGIPSQGSRPRHSLVSSRRPDRSSGAPLNPEPVLHEPEGLKHSPGVRRAAVAHAEPPRKAWCDATARWVREAGALRAPEPPIVSGRNAGNARGQEAQRGTILPVPGDS